MKDFTNISLDENQKKLYNGEKGFTFFAVQKKYNDDFFYAFKSKKTFQEILNDPKIDLLKNFDFGKISSPNCEIKFGLPKDKTNTEEGQLFLKLFYELHKKDYTWNLRPIMTFFRSNPCIETIIDGEYYNKEDFFVCNSFANYFDMEIIFENNLFSIKEHVMKPTREDDLVPYAIKCKHNNSYYEYQYCESFEDLDVSDSSHTATEQVNSSTLRGQSTIPYYDTSAFINNNNNTSRINSEVANNILGTNDTTSLSSEDNNVNVFNEQVDRRTEAGSQMFLTRQDIEDQIQQEQLSNNSIGQPVLIPDEQVFVLEGDEDQTVYSTSASGAYPSGTGQAYTTRQERHNRHINKSFRLYGIKQITPLYFKELSVKNPEERQCFIDFINNSEDFEIRLLKEIDFKICDIGKIDKKDIKLKIKNLNPDYKKLYI